MQIQTIEDKNRQIQIQIQTDKYKQTILYNRKGHLFGDGSTMLVQQGTILSHF